MYTKNFINLEETRISLKTDLKNNNLENYVLSIRNDLKNYIKSNNLFLNSLKPVNINSNAPPIIKLMEDSSRIANVGPMASVAGSIAELSCDYLINLGSICSIVENGGDIALINNKKVICGIYSGNNKLKTNIGFKLKPRKKQIGICTSSGKIGHSLSFGESESVTVLSNKASYSDSLATAIANEVTGNSYEESLNNALNFAEEFREYFQGVLIINGDFVGKIGKLPEIISTKSFDIDF
ncbi:UPF0280 family protein [Methanobrevibacter sp. OttesenSCG-928-K11]|nr:UPF0280 family protein [Methanobrevibacter sp. OttesenSCG-928-K11]MDL2270919.1 UPF0280 family protein [Methanobrevibacter sp. OttesenSCG-928-I08]